MARGVALQAPRSNPARGASAARLDTLLAAESPEGIRLLLRPAGLTARAMAFAIDALIRIAIYFVVLTTLAGGGGLALALAWIGLFLIEWLYPVVFELSAAGATPGKRAMKLQVVMDNGLPVTPGASLLRNLLRGADFLPALYAFGILCLLLRRDFKRLGDLAAGTLVVHRPPAAPVVAPFAGPPLEPPRPLSAAQQNAIVQWALRVPRLTAPRAEELARLADSALPPPHDAAVPAPAGSTAAPPAADSATGRLLAMAQWLLGHRAGGTAR